MSKLPSFYSSVGAGLSLASCRLIQQVSLKCTTLSEVVAAGEIQELEETSDFIAHRKLPFMCRFQTNLKTQVTEMYLLMKAKVNEGEYSRIF